MQTFVEVHTNRHDGRIVVHRKAATDNREGVLQILKILSSGFYYTSSEDEMSSLVLFQKPLDRPQNKGWGGELDDWMYGNSPVYRNDFGEVCTICIRKFGDKAQVDEGTFYL